MKKWLILLFTAIATTTAAAQSDEEITVPVEPLQSNESEGEEIQELAPEAPVVINERIDEEPEFDIPAPPDKAPETIEDLQLQLEKNTKTYKMYKAFQYTSVTVAGIGLLLVILDAFIDTGSEYPFTPIPSDTNPDPSPVTTAFGNLSIAGAVVAVVGTGASIGFQFPYRKHRNQQYILEEKIRNLQELEETQTGLEDLVKEVIVD